MEVKKTQLAVSVKLPDEDTVSTAQVTAQGEHMVAQEIPDMPAIPQEPIVGKIPLSVKVANGDELRRWLHFVVGSVQAGLQLSWRVAVFIWTEWKKTIRSDQP